MQQVSACKCMYYCDTFSRTLLCGVHYISLPLSHPVDMRPHPLALLWIWSRLLYS